MIKHYDKSSELKLPREVTGKQKNRITSAIRRHNNGVRSTKYDIVRLGSKRIYSSRYEDYYHVRNIKTGARYKATFEYGQLGNSFWRVTKMKRR